MRKIFNFVMFGCLFIFVGCVDKNNIQKQKSYEKLDEVSVIGMQSGIYVERSIYSDKSMCENQAKQNFDGIINIVKLNKLLENRKVKITSIDNPTKKLLVIKPNVYSCINSKTSVVVILYDVEKISKNWTSQDRKQIFKDISTLNDENIIYKKMFTLDNKYNIHQSFDLFGIIYHLDDNPKKAEKDIEKFFVAVIEDLNKVMDFPDKEKTEK